MIEIMKKFIYRIQKGDTLVNICERFNTTKENITRNNNEIPLYIGEFVEIIVNNYKTHIVKPTETLESISNKYNLTIDEIMGFNNLTTQKLFIGQFLKIKTQ